MNLDGAFRYIDEHRDRFLTEFFDFLRIPSISAHPDRDADVARALDFVKRKLESLGFTTEIWPTRSHAGLFAERIVSADLPTVLIYGHVDVQPVDPLDLWTSPPFDPVIRDGSVWARGADDNKGQHFAQIVGVEAALKGGGGLPVNVKFIIEADEEYDGEAMADELPKHAEKLRCDVFVVSDASMPDLEHPAVTTVLRGITAAEFTVTGPSSDRHSGEWGGMIYEPIDVVRWVLQNLKDFETGRVLIPGFYDDVVVPTTAERKSLESSPWNDAAKAKEIGVARLFHEEGFTPRESGVIRPTFQVNGIFGGYTDKGFKTVIGNAATAKVSMRLVHDQNPETIYGLFEKRVRELVGDKGRVTFKRYGNGLPFHASLDSPYVKAGLEALEAGYGKPAITFGMGGSIPIVAPLVRTTGAACVLLGYGLPEDNLHAPDEHFRLDSFFGGARTSAAYLEAVGALAKTPAKR